MAGQKKQRATRITESSLIYAYRVPLLIFRLCQNIVYPFVKVGGAFISYKSSNIDEELDQGKKGIYLLGGKVSDVHKFSLPDSDLQRSFVVIQKEKKTPKAYPRKAGMPSKDPLH